MINITKLRTKGYHVSGYGYTENDISRELGQAGNILNVLNQNPNAKILVHCGLNHLVEKKHPDGIRTMAQEVRSLADIDPLTIDQVQLSEHSSPDFEHPLYRFFDVDKPAVLLDNNKRLPALKADNSIVDLREFIPKQNLCTEDRPGCTETAPGRANSSLTRGETRHSLVHCLPISRIILISEMYPRMSIRAFQVRIPCSAV